MRVEFKDLILFENDDLYVINKPSGVSCLAEHTASTRSLYDITKEFDLNARLCHRLDKYTSGCLIISKNDETYRHVAMAFENRTISKTYHTVVHGSTAFENELVDVPLVKKVNGTAIWAKSGKPSATTFTTLESFGHYSLVECKPQTGRFHQIRIHLKFKEHPIAADDLYGGHAPHLSEVLKRYKASARDENPMIRRYALHAYALSFMGLKEETIEVSCPYPKDFATLIKLLRKNDR